MKDLLKDYAFVMDIRVAWGDMDAFQHVNNTVYFKYFETTRIAYFEKIDPGKEMKNAGVASILASTQCKYILPLTYPDTISVGAKVETIADQYFIMKYSIISQKYQKLATIGEGKVVLFDYSKNIKASISDDIRKAIIDLEKNVIQIAQQ